MWRQSVLMMFFALCISHINSYRVNRIQEHNLPDQAQSDESNKEGNAPLDLEEVKTKNVKVRTTKRLITHFGDYTLDIHIDKFKTLVSHCKILLIFI